MENWKQIWNNRIVSNKDISDLQDLINANGYDTCGLNETNLTEYIKHIIAKMKMAKGSTVYEVGCGCGSILYLFKLLGMQVGGLDYSKSLIDIAKNINISTDLVVDEAINLKTDKKYDYVVSNGLFHYFKDLEYTEAVTHLMMKKSSKGHISILDVNDEDKKELSLNIRREKEPNYDEKYKGFEHFYIKKSFWIELALKNNWQYTIEDQAIEGYKNTKFRYNIYFKK